MGFGDDFYKGNEPAMQEYLRKTGSWRSKARSGYAAYFGADINYATDEVRHFYKPIPASGEEAETLFTTETRKMYEAREAAGRRFQPIH